MKIGIITFQRAENYGASLQCRALFEFLRANGHEVEIIDYRNPIIEKNYTLLPRPRRNLLKYAESIIFVMSYLKELKSKKEKFSDFLNKTNITRSFSKDELLNTILGYDVIITGSDQVWNPAITKGLDLVYYLRLPGDYRKVAYAVSLGDLTLPIYASERFLSYCSDFDYISVREDKALDTLSKRLNNKVIQTIDPTLLLTTEEWDLLTENVTMDLPKKYILVYDLISHGDINAIARKISTKYDMPIIHIVSHKQFGIGFGDNCINLIDIGPLEFVHLIKNAEKIITSSFHGAVFSCIYKKDVYIYIAKRRLRADTRLHSLAKMFGIENRVISSEEEWVCNEMDAPGPIKYDTKIFNIIAEQSKNYINNATSNIPH